MGYDQITLPEQVATIMGSERVFWTNNGIAPFSVDTPEIGVPLFSLCTLDWFLLFALVCCRACVEDASH